ncbi:MAG: restriction endonuclease [Desulfuromonas sp.]|nr:MAG: restriction endonuclease [Desulfuromonas sp.]
MKPGTLSECFEGVATKYLSAVEAHPDSSNQHEFNGVKELKLLIGPERLTTKADFIYLGEDPDKTEKAEGFLTWYDARENHPTRSEYRLYFPSNIVTDMATAGDLIIFGKRTTGNILVIVARENSTSENQLLWLFGLQPQKAEVLFKEVEDSQVGYVEQTILEHLDIEVVSTDDQHLDLMLDRFNGTFPSTRIFSAFARETCGVIDSVSHPDDTLVEWLNQEEKLFRSMERHIVSKRLREGFDEDVDQFVSFSLSVHNRRKSRAGHSLENHLEQIFTDNNLVFERGAITENRSKPDFLFPGQEPYHSEDFPDSRLTMLGVKTTCKDRWRQVLTEADRIPQKHLLTLEPGISEHQTNEMASQSLHLVVPRAIYNSFSAVQQEWLVNVDGFIETVRKKQGPRPTIGLKLGKL